MAIRYAVATGNWSNTATWNGGTLPTSADDVYANLFTVTIDTSPTVLSVQNGTATGVTTAGGTFVPTNGITLTCTSGGVLPGTSVVILSSLTTGQSCSIVSTCRGTSGGGNAVNHTGAGTVNITGSCIPSFQSAVANSGTGIINITGDCGGSTSGGVGASNGGSGTINITGNCTVGGATNFGTGVLNITGSCTGTTATAVLNNSSGTLVHVGTVQSGSSSAAIGPGSTTQITILSGPFLTTANGINPVIAVRWFWANSTPPATYYQIRTQNLATIRPLYTADSVGGNPSASNVRSGTVFGPASELTGTMVVPPAGSVNFGVPVDNTTGTALVTASSVINAIWNYPISGITTSGSIGERLKNTATVDAVNTILSNGLR